MNFDILLFEIDKLLLRLLRRFFMIFILFGVFEFKILKEFFLVFLILLLVFIELLDCVVGIFNFGRFLYKIV